MSDTTQILQLPEALLESIDRDGDDSITLHFSKVFLVQEMEGAIVYTYRDHAPLPIDWRGDVQCKLVTRDSGSSVTISGESMQLEQIDHPRYIRHIKK
jgi:hypothetical protein